MMLILYFLVAYGISFAFVESMGPFDIFQKLREYMAEKHTTFEYLFDCMFCFPTWVGFILSLINVLFFPYIPFTPFNIALPTAPIIVIIVLDMFATASGVYLIATFQEMLERINKHDN